MESWPPRNIRKKRKSSTRQATTKRVAAPVKRSEFDSDVDLQDLGEDDLGLGGGGVVSKQKRASKNLTGETTKRRGQHQHGAVNQFYQRVRATSNAEQVADPANPDAGSLGSENVDINVVGPTSPASHSRRASTRSDASDESRSRRDERRKNDGSWFSTANVSKMVLVASAAAMWGYIAYMYWKCGEKVCCTYLTDAVAAIRKAPDFPKAVAAFTFGMGTLLLLATLLEGFYHGITSLIGEQSVD